MAGFFFAADFTLVLRVDNFFAWLSELSIEISRKLVELAADGVTDPAQLRRLTLESSPLSPAH